MDQIPQDGENEQYVALLYNTSWWDFGGIEFEIGGIDPNCRRPKLDTNR